jgi:UDP-glucose-4-epimerase GalE
MSWVAITGGCGYIGSHVAAEIRRHTDHQTLLIDRRASRLRYTHHLGDRILERDFSSDEAFMEMEALKPVALIHCAGTSLVGPSMSDPSEYYHNNVARTLRLMDWARNRDIPIIFSSSSSIYGDTVDGICHEGSEKAPISPYARTKWIIEQMLQDYWKAYGLPSISLRYFNAAGSDDSGAIGQLPDASHLVAAVCEHVIYGRRLEVFGTDYNTKDGTAIRDYTHVSDIARAHVLAMDHVSANPGALAFNLGTGKGSTVMDVIGTASGLIGVSIHPILSPRRPGDPARRAADYLNAKWTLGWQPERSLDQVVASAFNWYNSDTYRQLRFANR